MNFLSTIPICVALVTAYSFGFPIEESEQVMSTTQSSSSSTTSSSMTSSSTSYLSNIFDFSGLTDRFKGWSAWNGSKASDGATNESTQICEKKEVTEESQTQSSSNLELEKCSSQYSALAQDKDSIRVTENQETAIKDQSAFIEETSVEKEKKSISTQTQDKGTFQSTDNSAAAYSQAEVESGSMSSFQNEKIKKGLSQDLQSQAINEDAALECASIAETTAKTKAKNPSQVEDCDTTAVSQVSEAENVSILDSMSQSISSIMNTSSSSNSQSQTTNFAGTTQEDNVAAFGSAATVDTTAGDKKKKMKSALVQEDSEIQTSQMEIAASEQTSEIKSQSNSESLMESALGTRDLSTSNGSLDVVNAVQGNNKITTAESTAAAETLQGSERKKRKLAQTNDAIQAVDMETAVDKACLQTEADAISPGTEAMAVVKSSIEGGSKDVSIKESEISSKVKNMEEQNSQIGIDQSLNINTMSSNQDDTSFANSIAVSDAASECKQNKKNALETQSVENTTQSTSSQAETKSESFFSSVVNDASNMVFGSEKNACSNQEMNSSMKTQGESAVVSQAEGIVESVTETVTTITSSILSSSTTESSAMTSESLSGIDANGAEAISISKAGVSN